MMMDTHPLMDLKTDYAFKQLFGQPQTADILMAFVNALLKRQDSDRFVASDWPNTEIAPSRRSGKGKRLDVYVHSERGERLHIEIQVGRMAAWPKRSLLYWSSLYEAQALAGMDYGALHRVITINIVNFVMLPSTARYHTSYHVYEDAQRFLLTDVFEVHCVELPKFRRTRGGQMLAIAQDPLGRWLLLLDAAKNRRIREALEVIAMADPTMDHALAVWEELSQDPGQYAAYLSRRMALLDEVSQVHSAEQKGLEKGLQRGLERGLEKGLEKGFRQAQWAIARAMLADGESIARVMKLTGLPAEEVADLQRHES